MNSLFTYGDQLARERAEWYPINRDLIHKEIIAVQNMNETRNAYSRVMENMNGADNTITLRTRYKHDYAPPDRDVLQHIFYRNKWFEISEVRPRELGNLGLHREIEYHLVLIEVNYGQDFRE